MSSIDRCDGARTYAARLRQSLLAPNAHPEHDAHEPWRRSTGRSGRRSRRSPTPRRGPARRSRPTMSSTARAGRVDHDRVVGRPQRRRRPAAVERVAPVERRLHLVDRDVRGRPRPRRAGAGGPAPRRSRSRNTFTGASGNTTVPMSRPSTTPPPCSRDPRPLAGDEHRAHRRVRRDRRHRGRSPRARGSPRSRRARRACVTPSSSSIVDGLARPPRTRRRRRASTPALEHRERDRPVHRAGVEHVRARARRRRRARPSTSPSPTARRSRRRASALDRHAAPVSRREVVGELRDTTTRPPASPRTVALAVDRVGRDRRRHRDAVVAVALQRRGRAARRPGSTSPSARASTADARAG